MSGDGFDRSFLRLRCFACFDFSGGAKLDGGKRVGDR